MNRKPMIRTSTLLIALIFLLAPRTLAAQEAGIIPGDILVMITPNGKPQSIADDLRSLDGVVTGLQVVREVSSPMRIWLLRFDNTAIAQRRMLSAIQGHPQVMLAQNDHPVSFRQVPNDPQYGQQWHHQNIDSEVAWGISTGGVTATGDTIVVCVIEASNLLHADLVANHWFNHAEIANNGVDDDGNGYVDDHDGWNPGANNDNNLYGGGHGTNVAGMIGARGDNNLAVAGANWNVKIMVVTVGSLSQANVIASYTYPWMMRRLYNETNGERGAFVVATNASWGIDNGDPNDYPLWCAIYDSLGTDGILSCGATANNNVNVDVVGDLPTACSSDHMISVTATNENDQRTFSAYGLTTIDVGAPGSGVVTTNGTTAGATGTTSTSGTSFASPLTAGVIGLLYSAPCPSLMALVQSDPQAGALYIRQQLFAGVEQVGNLPGATVTGGRINAGNSMQLIMADCASCPAPYNTAITPTAATTATYSWSAFGGGAFTVRYREVGAPDWIEVPGVDDPFFEVTGLTPCTAYEFQVSTDCNGENSGFTGSSLLEPPVVQVPGITVEGYPMVCEGGSVTLFSTSSINNVWSTGETTASIAVDQAGSYTVTVDNGCEQATSLPVQVGFLSPTTPIAEDVQLPGPGSAQLTAEGENITWYDAPGGAVVAEGNTFDTPVLNSSTSYWATSTATDGLDTYFGARTNNTTSGQYHTNANFWQVFEAYDAFTLVSVKVYANAAGSRPIALVTMPEGTVVQQGNFTIPNGESRVELDFEVPGPGVYGLRVLSGNPQLWRDGTGSNQTYPYPLGTVGAVTTSTATGTNALAYYYFFYDWEVRTPGVACESDPVQVNVDIATGLDMVTGQSGLRAYPSPADRELVLEWATPLPQGTNTLQVLDAVGRLAVSDALVGTRTVVNTASLADGIYTFRILNGSAELVTGRFVVAHR